MNVRFNLKSKRYEKSLILLKIRYLKGVNNPFVLSTSQIIPIKFWDDDLMRVKKAITEKRKRIEYPQHVWINALLNKYETIVLDRIRKELVEKGTLPSYKELKQHVKSQFITEPEEEDITFKEYFNAQIEKKRLDTKNYKPITLKKYTTTINNITIYEKKTGNVFMFNNMTTDFLKAWQQWNFNAGRSHNTVASMFSKVKVILNEAIEDGLYELNAHKSKKLSLNFQSSDEVFLSVKELMKMYDLDLTGSHLETVRDLFLFDAFSGGFRFKDLEEVNSSNIIPINNKRAIKFTTHKTDSLTYVPANWYFEEFMSKYRGKFPKTKASQVFNRQIKEVAKMAGLVKLVKLRKNKGGQNVGVTKYLHEWITQYTGRYSFATNLSLAGVTTQQISFLLGHKKITTTEKYIKSNQLHTILAVADNPYFTTKPIAL